MVTWNCITEKEEVEGAIVIVYRVESLECSEHGRATITGAG